MQPLSSENGEVRLFVRPLIGTAAAAPNAHVPVSAAKPSNPAEAIVQLEALEEPERWDGLS